MDSFLQILQQEQENPSWCDEKTESDNKKLLKRDTFEEPPQAMTQTRFSMQSVTMARTTMSKEALLQSVQPSSSVNHAEEEDVVNTSVYI